MNPGTIKATTTTNTNIYKNTDDENDVYSINPFPIMYPERTNDPDVITVAKRFNTVKCLSVIEDTSGYTTNKSLLPGITFIITKKKISYKNPEFIFFLKKSCN